MKTRLLIATGILFACACGVLAQGGGKAEPLRIMIPKGKTSVSAAGDLKGDQIAEYVFSARKDQIVIVRLVSTKSKVRLHNFIVKGDAIDFESEMPREEVEKFLAPETGDYFIFVTLKHPPQNKTRQRGYKLTLEIRN